MGNERIQRLIEQGKAKYLARKRQYTDYHNRTGWSSAQLFSTEFTDSLRQAFARAMLENPTVFAMVDETGKRIEKIVFDDEGFN